MLNHTTTYNHTHDKRVHTRKSLFTEPYHDVHVTSMHTTGTVRILKNWLSYAVVQVCTPQSSRKIVHMHHNFFVSSTFDEQLQKHTSVQTAESLPWPHYTVLLACARFYALTHVTYDLS